MQQLTTRKAISVLKNEISVHEFVPEGVWITGCTEPYRDLDSNYPLMLDNSTMFVTRALVDNEGEEIPTAAPSGGTIVAISFMNTVPCKAGLRHRMDFYPNVSAFKNESLLVGHFFEHMVHVYKNQLNFDRYNFSLLIPQDYSQDMLRAVLISIGVDFVKEDTAYLIEGDILPSSKL